MNPETVVRCLREQGTVLLDTILPDSLGQSTYLFAHPQQVVESREPQRVAHALRELDRQVAAGRWVAGYVAYEAGYALEPSLRIRHHPVPLLWFGVYDRPLELQPDELTRVLESDRIGPFGLSKPRLGVVEVDYMESVERIRGHIREGNVYQVNYTAPLSLDFEGDVLGLYAALRRRQPVPYAALLQTGARTVLSLSPELFFLRNGDRIVTRPMKGTAPAAGDQTSGDREEDALRRDPKNRAENLMIVDLLRNDLSVCCRPGSVVVSELFGVQRYPTVLQMTSTIEGTLVKGVGYSEIFGSLFPSGSVTGAPKIRAMELISDIEKYPRGVYCGAVGFVAPDERATFNVAIRTVTIDESAATMGTGSGIVWDSVAEHEYQECLLKTRFLVDAGSP